MFLDWLFGNNNNQNTIDLTINSVLPDKAKNDIEKGILPTFNTATIILSKNEICHFIDRAIHVTEEKQRNTQIFRASNSIRIMKGWTIHIGNGNLTPNYKNVAKYNKGLLYITSNRIMFSSKEGAFDKKLTELSAIMPYSDGVGLQFGDKVYNVMLVDPIYAVTIINVLTSK